MAQLQEILSHPDFLDLPDSEKQKALVELIPGFGDLPQSEQLKGMADIMGRVNQPQAQPTAAPAPAPTDPTAESLGMFQPGNLVPSMDTIKEQAPIAGAMVTAPFKTSPILAPISGMGASAAALMAGQGGEPMGPTDIPDVTGASLNQFNAPLAPFAMGAGAEAGGQALFGLAGKALAPFKESFAAKLAASPETKAAQELVEQGVPLSPGGYSGAKRFQWIADNFMPGSLIVNKRRQEVSDAILKMRQEFIENTLDLPKYTESIPKAMANVREQFGKFVEQAGGKEATIPMPNTIKYIQDNMNNPITSTDTWWKKKFIPWTYGKNEPVDISLITKKVDLPKFESKNELSNVKSLMDTIIGNVEKKPQNFYKTVDEINTIHANYNKGWNKLTPIGKNLRNGLRESIYKDLATHDLQTGLKLEDALNAAQSSAKYPKDIAKARWVEKALLNPATDIVDEGFVFSPLKFERQVNQNLTNIERMLGEEGLNTIRAFADKMKLASPDMNKLGKVSDATNAMRKATGFGMLTVPGAIAAGSTGTAAALAVPYGFQTIVAKSLMNPSGWLRKWLTSGLSPSKLFTKEAPKLGIMEATNAD